MAVILAGAGCGSVGDCLGLTLLTKQHKQSTTTNIKSLNNLETGRVSLFSPKTKKNEQGGDLDFRMATQKLEEPLTCCVTQWKRRMGGGWPGEPDEPFLIRSCYTVGTHTRNCVTWIRQSPSSSESYMLVREDSPREIISKSGQSQMCQMVRKNKAEFPQEPQWLQNRIHLSSLEKTALWVLTAWWQKIAVCVSTENQAYGMACEIRRGKVAKTQG